ncbi:MAG: AIPR family protein [Vampirovibrionia bacterium]
MDDKELLKGLKNFTKDKFPDDFERNGFPYACMRIFFRSLEDDAIDNAIAGLHYRDCGIDAFWIDDEDSCINIAQFKSTNVPANKSPSANRAWFTDLKDIDERLKNNTEYLRSLQNEKLMDISLDYQQYSKKEYSVQKYLIYFGTATPELIAAFEKDITFYGIHEIREKWNDYNAMIKPTDPEKCELEVDNINNSDLKNVLKHHLTNSYSTYIGIISAFELVKLRKEHSFLLFDRNIRYYLGHKNTVNKGIIETACHDNEYKKFFAYNNGITITCSECKPKEVSAKTRLILKHPQIINGAQTVNSLYEAHKQFIKNQQLDKSFSKEGAESSAEKRFSDIKVLFRVIVSTKGDDTLFATNLTRYNNSQNAVKVSDFFANLPEQERIQKEFKKYGYFYERKRGEKNSLTKIEKDQYNKLDIDIGIVKLASALQAFKGHPASKEVGEKYVLRDPKDPVYKSIFPEVKKITNQVIKEMIFAANLLIIIEKKAKLFKKILRQIEKIDNNKEAPTELNPLSELINEIGIFNSTLIRDILEEKGEWKEIIYDIRLLSQGKYFILAIIVHVLQTKQNLEKIYEQDLFMNEKFIEDQIINKWLQKIVKKYMKPVRKEENKKRSENAFFLDRESFQRVLETMEDRRRDDDLGKYETEFPIEVS